MRFGLYRWELRPGRRTRWHAFRSTALEGPGMAVMLCGVQVPKMMSRHGLETALWDTWIETVPAIDWHDVCGVCRHLIEEAILAKMDDAATAGLALRDFELAEQGAIAQVDLRARG